MQTISNPFHKPNPFKISQYNKFEHPNFNNKKHPQFNQKIYKQPHAVQLNNYFQNNWNFHADNLKKKHNLKKEELSKIDLSTFSINLKTNDKSKRYKNDRVLNQEKNNNEKDGNKLQNPFLRKNLLVNRQQVVNQLAIDISIYRNKAASNYEVTGSHYVYENSPIIAKEKTNQNRTYNREYTQRVNSIPFNDQNGEQQSAVRTLVNQKTQQRTQKGIKEGKQDASILNFKGKTFYLFNLN